MSRLRNNLNELDALLQGLQTHRGVSGAASSQDYTDYSDLDYGEEAPSRPPPPDETHLLAPPGMIHSKKKRKIRAPSSVGSGKSTLSIPSKPPHPPKLQHELKNHVHDLVKATKQDDDILRAPDEFGDDSEREHEEEEKEEEEDYDYGSVDISNPEEVDAGEAPRGDASMVIHTDYGDLKSKYHYLGFGLWENTEPDEPPPPPRKLSPPPPPPKAEPIWYNCTVSLEEHQKTPEPVVIEVSEEEEQVEEPDFCEPLAQPIVIPPVEPEPEKDYPTCFTCSQLIRGRIITAMAKKFHPNCFVCSYCKKPFRNRQFKTDNSSSTPYCHPCFEKLLGHFGNVRTVNAVA